VEYFDSRSYQPGDLLKNIDWKHTLKLNQLIVKEYIEVGGQVAIIAVNLSVTDAEVALGVSVEVGFNQGGGRNVHSYVLGGAGIDPAKDTLLHMVDKLTGVKVKPGISGRIKEIRYCAGNIIDAKEMQAKIEFIMPIIKGPREYVFGSGASGATLGGQAPTDVRDVDIPVKENDVIDVTILANDALDSATLSFQVV